MISADDLDRLGMTAGVSRIRRRARRADYRAVIEVLNQLRCLNAMRQAACGDHNGNYDGNVSGDGDASAAHRQGRVPGEA